MIPGLKYIEKEIYAIIQGELDKAGILYRLFSRSKDKLSILEKIKRKQSEGEGYIEGGKLMQDIVGVRIVTYFKDDVDIVYSLLENKMNYLNEEIDDLDLTVFKPKRTNVICQLNKKHSKMLNEIRLESDEEFYKVIDNTFELQFRTVLSEGWHEIDHGLRYKCKSDWIGHSENERMLNGIYASLETNDIALNSLFRELSYKHYKSSSWEGLIRTKFRLRLQITELTEEITEILNNDNNLAKQILQLNRKEFINWMCLLDFPIPLSLNTLVYLSNIFELKNDALYKVTPKYILKELIQE